MCGDSYKKSIEKLGHDYELINVVKATCTEDGYYEYQCTRCGDSYKKVIEKLGHNYELSKTADATCTEDGYKEYTCTRCKDSYKKVTDKKLGHDFSKKVDHKDSTCIKKGYDLYQCTRCEETEKHEFDLIPHNYELTKTVNATCTENGYYEYTCTMCKDSYKTEIPKLGHDYKLTKTVDATCTKDGYYEYTCTRCGDSYQTPIEKLGHDFSKKVDHKDSTCVEKGYDLYQCTRCEETEKHEFDLIPHDYDMNTEVERVDSTCSTHGHVNYACKVCGDIKTVELDLNPENHSYTETGRDLQYIYYKCSECGAEKKEFNDQEYTIDLGNGKTTTVVGHFDLEMRDKILEIINEKRANYAGGIPLLSLPGDATPLQDAANTRAIEITYSYSHTRPNGNRAITDLYAYAHTDAENLAKGQQSAEQVCNDWFTSPTHDDNIMNDSYSTVGISVFCQKLAEDDYVNNFSQLFSTLEHY